MTHVITLLHSDPAPSTRATTRLRTSSTSIKTSQHNDIYQPNDAQDRAIEQIKRRIVELERENMRLSEVSNGMMVFVIRAHPSV